jgi:ABC-type polysaccharide/polyol phosphate transport system ATPase subunit
MRARLGLTVADQIRPNVFLLDEVHEALDHEFRAVLEHKAHQLLDAGGIVVAAGHDHPMLARLSTRAIWMEDGAVRGDGPFEEVRVRYLEAVEAASPSEM